MRDATTSEVEITVDAGTRPARQDGLSPAIKWTLAVATVLTFGFAGLSAWAVHSEPTMRAEDSTYESQSKALAVRRSVSQPRNVVAFADSGATRADEYLDRAVALDRSL